MKYYELTYLISPDLSEAELKTFSEKINSFILEEEGKPEKAIVPTRIKLGYPIKKKTEAFLTTLNFHLNPEKLEGLEKKLKSESRILRYLILTKKAPKKVLIEEPLPKIKKPPKLPEKGTTEPKKVELKDIDKKIEEILKE